MASRKVALVTGGNNGIGYETVKALLQSKRPYQLLVGSRSIEKGKLAIDKLRKECPDATNTLEFLEVDLTSDESIEKAFEQVKTSPGHLDVLINNAGLSPLLVSHGFPAKLKSPRRNLRHRIPRRTSLPPRVLHEILRRECRRHQRANLDIHAAPPQINRPTPHFRGRTLQHHEGGRALLSHTTSAGWLAEGDRLRDDWVSVQQGGAEYVDAGLES
jgi:NAD(P)-dependent dehydrogenase (short-subunit alcohol dehydrogenase family)